MSAKYRLNNCDATLLQNAVVKPYRALFLSARAATKMLIS
jgi:hypothetical protein